jgi:hypothetical protein
MTSSWTAHPLLASPRSACSAAERHPSDRGHDRWIFALGPHGSVPQRSSTGISGHQPSPTVQTNHRSSILQFKQQG